MDGRFYSSRHWRFTRRRVLRRDGYRCRAVESYGDVTLRCEATRDLDVHHVVRPEDGGSLYGLENLLTLCPLHHGRLHHVDPVLSASRRRRRRPRLRPAAASYRPFNPDEPDVGADLADPEYLRRSAGWAA